MSEVIAITRLDLSETVDPYSSDVLLKPADIAELFLPNQNGDYDIEAFVESYKEEYGVDISANELDEIVRSFVPADIRKD